MDLIVSSYSKNCFLSAVSRVLVEEVHTSRYASDVSQTTLGSSLSDRTTMHLGGYLHLFLYRCPIVIQQPATSSKITCKPAPLSGGCAVVGSSSRKCRITVVALQLVADRGHIHTVQLSCLSRGCRPLTSTSKSQTNQVIEAAADHSVPRSPM